MLGTGDDFRGWQNYLEAPLTYCGLLCLLILPQVFVSGHGSPDYLRLFLAGMLIPTVFPWFRYLFWLFQGDYYRTLFVVLDPWDDHSERDELSRTTWKVALSIFGSSQRHSGVSGNSLPAIRTLAEPHRSQFKIQRCDFFCSYMPPSGRRAVIEKANDSRRGSLSDWRPSNWSSSIESRSPIARRSARGVESTGWIQ